MLDDKTIMNHLIKGGKVAPKTETSFRGFYVRYSENSDKFLIFYNNHGSSAVGLSYKKLNWLINTIFKGIENLELKSNDYYVYA